MTTWACRGRDLSAGEPLHHPVRGALRPRPPPHPAPDREGGYYWARQGLFDQDSAAHYLKTWRDRQQGQSAYMQVLGLGQRRPVASEEKYISDWMDKGFPPETVALAYDKTIFYKKTAGVAVSQRHPPPLARKRLAHAGGGPAGRRRKARPAVPEAGQAGSGQLPHGKIHEVVI